MMSAMDAIGRHAHWALRIALASVFLYHGPTKFGQLSEMAAGLGLSVAVLALVALAETVGPILILIGGFTTHWLTRLGALMLIPVMLGAIFMVHWGQWSFLPSETHKMGGIEFQVTLLLIQVYFVLKGNEPTIRRAAPAPAPAEVS